MKKFSYILLVLLVILCVGCCKEDYKSGKINCNQMKEIMKQDNNPQLVDVRNQDEYEQGHLDDAINIPVQGIVGVMNLRESVDKDTPIIVYCKSGTRSKQAYDVLIKDGYKSVYDLGAMESCK